MDHFSRGLIEAKVRKAKCILQPVRGEQRRDVMQVAAAEDQRDDRLRGDGIEARRGRIVEHDRRLIDQRARDRNAAAHAAGKFGGKAIDGVLHLDEGESFDDALLDLGFFRLIFFAQAEGNVVGDVHRIEERAFLEYETHLLAKLEQVFLAHLGNVVAHHGDAAFVGMDQAGGHFHEHGFAGVGLAEQHFGFAGLHVEGDVAQDFGAFGAEIDVAERNEGLARGHAGCDCARCLPA